jgi:hypothetical protein
LGRNRGGDASDKTIFLVNSDKERLGVACIFGKLLEAQAKRLKLGRVFNVALEKNNGTNSVVLDE